MAAVAHFAGAAGASLGARAWGDVVTEQRAAGDGAHPVTPTGLDARKALPAGQILTVDAVRSRDLGTTA
ncbi:MULTISPECIES: hypothetical protein [Streptomyces]|uniref:Uncharacterized protein n=1 Tax=Streptomyces clavifer TaxID=68188 RepID=A0ABS4V5D8_9ACTN|nr:MULTISPECIES: hypothetical protein [Streptomyces]MBP2359133.1 hypothetical protein [Streptomyces clavifer]MDX2745809.1 hypothetical protein [Streptomyces sp. NRRL_B-2557]MDX3061991.1 hypothetical protein [Streptomyces sp. ND04-05B]WRY84123.1 hypothetical protein OG388_24265 [Streptomyces clavifer]WUC29890.1 hypothetical protein OG927_22170 [Streptomyces clavifer]